MRPYTFAPLLCLPAVLMAQNDRPGAKDHPLITRMPGVCIHGDKTWGFDSTPFLTDKANKMERMKMEGKKTELQAQIKKGNRRLSEDRAQAVKAALVAAGIETTRLRAKGSGPDQPVADHRTEEGRAKNRRVERVKR